MSEENARARPRAASPGVGGAMKDALAAIAGAVAPRSVVQRRSKINEQVEGTERMRSAQSTDKHNP